MRLKWWSVALVLLAALLAAFLLPERNHRPFSDPEGVIWKGQKFGILIGGSDVLNRRALQQQGWVYDHTQRGGGCIRHHYSDDYALMVFVDESWRHGLLCVITKSDKVRAVEWFYGPFWIDL